jgi:hypothetical protein
MGTMRNAYRILARKPEAKILSGRLRHRLEDNIKMSLKIISCEGMGWIHLLRKRTSSKFM